MHNQEPGVNVFYDELFKWWNIRLHKKSKGANTPVIDVPESGDEGQDLSCIMAVKGEPIADCDPYLDTQCTSTTAGSPPPSSLVKGVEDLTLEDSKVELQDVDAQPGIDQASACDFGVKFEIAAGDLTKATSQAKGFCEPNLTASEVEQRIQYLT